MKKQVNWTSVLFFVIVLAAGILVGKIQSTIRQTEIELAVNKALAKSRPSTSYAIAGDDVADKPRTGSTVEEEFITMVDLTTGETCNRSHPIVLEADHKYRLVYTIPKGTTSFNLDEAVFRVDWWSLSVSDGEASPLVAFLSDDAVTYEDAITLTAEGQDLRFWPGTIAAYVLYSGDEQMGTLAPGAVNGLVGASVLNGDARGPRTPTHIVYEFETEIMPDKSSVTDEALSEQGTEGKITP